MVLGAGRFANGLGLRLDPANGGDGQKDEAADHPAKRCNLAYRERFGFPFVIAVKGLTRYDIITAMEKRLQGDPEVEFRECLVQIGRIAGFRLAALETA